MPSLQVNRFLAVVLFLFSTLLGLALLPVPAAAYYYDIKAYIDGVADLVIKGNTLQWHNINCYAPGTFPGSSNFPTTLTTNSTPVPVNWYPTWSSVYGDVWSSVYTGLTPALPHNPQYVMLTKVQARDNIYILQYPNAANDYTLIVRFNDGPSGGADWYEARLDLGRVTLVPLTLLLMGS